MKTRIAILLTLQSFILYGQDSVFGTIDQQDSVQMLQEFIVTSVSDETTQLRQLPVNISIVEAIHFYKTNATGLDLMRQVSGIKIKQSGGFGSRNDFFINGSTGKQVKFFIDGLPQDNLGETQALSIYPVEQIERIEVYKGVLPVDLGADALGAAINIVTRKDNENYFDASYSIASFNTHRLSASFKNYLSKQFFISMQANVNYAKNNYAIDGEVPNQMGNIEIKKVKRFHDVYKNYNIKLIAGFSGSRYADQLDFSLLKTGLYDEIQNNLLQSQPYGNAFYKESLIAGNVRYQKENLMKNFDIASVLSYNRVQGLFADTSRNVYNWEGSVIDRKYGGGEISSSPHELHIYNTVINAKIKSSYKFSDNVKLVFSNTYQRHHRTGKDTIAQKFYGGNDYYKTPSTLSKNIAGVGLEGSLMDSKLRLSTAVKYYATEMTAYEIEWLNQTITSQSLNAFAYNVAVGYTLNDIFLIKSSFEHASRLPESEEALGDMMLIKPNPKIQIEKSENINLNLLWSSRKIDGGVTGFFREVNDIIYLRIAQHGSQYQNLLRARVFGIEGNLKYQPTSSLVFNSNFTYQDLRNQSVITNSGINNDRYRNARLPNIPFFFVNAGISWRKDDVLQKNNSLQVWWNGNYTHEYFLYWEVDGARELKNRIPTQLLHSVGVSYALASKGISFSLEATNITNSKTYDNFKVQLPGRAVSLKIRFYHYHN